MTENLRLRLIDAIAGAMIDNAETLTSLDQAIGDGDHGHNMKRGFEAVLAEREQIAALDWPEALKKLGMTLVMKVGGASGPLYGTLFMEFGKAWPAQPDRAGIAEAMGSAIEGVQRRGKSSVGQKTMLDVLVPVQAALSAGGTGLADIADAAADTTVEMEATKGRASFLGPRSVGHMDPGARSSALMIRAAEQAIGESS